VKTSIDERFLVSPFFVFFLIYSSIISVEIMSFQRVIIDGAGYDAWISVLLSGLSIHILVWMIYRILRIANNDLIYINQFCFGKWIGGLLNVFIILYFLTSAFITLRLYIEVVQVWMFPLMKTWQISSIFLLLLYYIVSSGFRVITGICFWGTTIPFIILFPPETIFPLQFAHVSNLFPLFNHSVKEILVSSKAMLFQYLGFETLLMFYPFIKNPEKSQKWAHFGVLSATLLYLTVTIVAFVFFTQEHLKQTIWPNLTMLKIAEYPFVERFEYIVVSVWLLVVLPNISLRLWAACRGFKKLVNIKQHIILLIFLFVLFISTNVLQGRHLIQQFVDVYTNIGFYFAYLYIPIIFISIHIKQKITSIVKAKNGS
jgi:spore germination protein (amino acid permease)